MIGKFLVDNALKLLGIGSIFLLIALVVLGFKLHHANGVIEKRNLEIRAVTAERDRYRDALAFFVNDGILRKDRGVQALKDHAGVSADLQRQATKIRTRTKTVTVAGECRTPAEVMGAAGL